MAEQDTTRRSFLEATGTAASAVALGGAFAGETEAQETTKQDGGGGDRGRFQLINSTMSTLDPVKATDTASGEVIQQVFDALMNYPDGQTNVKPLLAKDYHVSDDYKTYTFNIRQGATFHDGEEVTAQDFVYSFERLAASDNSRRAYFILDSIGIKHSTDADGNYQPNSMAVEATDKHTLQMELAEPFHATLEMLAYTSFAAVPEGIVGDIGGYDGKLDYKEFARSQPVGAGPFTFEKWEPNTEALVSRYDDYHGEKAKVSGIHWQIMSSSNARYNYAMNKKQLVEQVFKGRGDPAYHLTPPAIYPGGPDAATKHAKQNYPYGYQETNLQKAREVMEEAGYGPNNRYKFTFTVYQSPNTWPEVGKLLRDKLASAHIDMSVETAPFSTLLKRGRNGKLQAFSLGWVMDWPAPDNFLQLLYPPMTDTSQSAPISYLNWSGTKPAKQAKQAWNTVQKNTAPTGKAEKQRNQAYVEMEEANWDDVAMLNVYHQLSQRFWYDYADIPKFGAAGTSRQMYNNVSVNRDE